MSWFALGGKPRIAAADQRPKQQQLYTRAQYIASQFSGTDRAPYQAAARDWRMPYWDWARRPSDGGPVYLPDFGEEMINIYGPKGWQQISNPLYSYRFSTRERLAFDFDIVWPSFSPVFYALPLLTFQVAKMESDNASPER